MALYDGLPLDTPTVIDDTPDYQTIATRTANGGTVETRPKAGSSLAQSVTESSFVGQRIPQVIDKARAIMADPVNATDWTAAERKVILAALVLDLNQRRR